MVTGKLKSEQSENGKDGGENDGSGGGCGVVESILHVFAGTRCEVFVRLKRAMPPALPSPSHSSPIVVHCNRCAKSASRKALLGAFFIGGIALRKWFADRQAVLMMAVATLGR